MDKNYSISKTLKFLGLIFLFQIAAIYIGWRSAVLIDELAVFGLSKELFVISIIFLFLTFGPLYVALMFAALIRLHFDINTFLNINTRLRICNTARIIGKIIDIVNILSVLVIMGSNILSYGFGWQVLYGLQSNYRLLIIIVSISVPMMYILMPEPEEFTEIQREAVYRKLYKNADGLYENAKELEEDVEKAKKYIKNKFGIK